MNVPGTKKAPLYYLSKPEEEHELETLGLLRLSVQEVFFIFVHFYQCGCRQCRVHFAGGILHFSSTYPLKKCSSAKDFLHIGFFCC